MNNVKGKNIDGFIIENLNLMYYLANRYRHEFLDENIYKHFEDSCLIKYLRACQLFDNQKGYKFSAILSKVIHNQFLNYKTRKKEKILFHINMVNLDKKNEEDNDHEIIEVLLSQNSNNIGNLTIINDIFDWINKNVKERNKNIFYDYLNGYTQVELSNKHKITQATVSRIIKKIQKDIRNEFGE